MSWSLEDNAIALRLAEEAVSDCPDDPGAYTALGNAFHHAAYLGGSVSRNEAIEKSIGLAQQALDMDNSLCEPHILLSALCTLKGEHERALAEAETAISLNPGSIDALSQYGWTLGFVGRNNDAIPVFQKIIRLNPYAKPTIFRGYGRALISAGRFEEAVTALKKAAQLAPDDIIRRCRHGPESLPPQARRHPERRRRWLQPPDAGRRGGHRRDPRNLQAGILRSHQATPRPGGGFPGDNLLAEFASVVDAVQCAVAVQKELQARNAELPENRQMLFRIGVNLGDVIEEGDRIYGDGVNIAARLESLATPGASASPRRPLIRSIQSCHSVTPTLGSRRSKTSQSQWGLTESSWSRE